MISVDIRIAAPSMLSPTDVHMLSIIFDAINEQLDCHNVTRGYIEIDTEFVQVADNAPESA